MTMLPVLDKGFVRLVESMGTDLSIVRSARVSYNADWRGGEDENKDERLLRYLYKNKHTSPFEAVVMTFEVKAPIFVLRQWHRHRTWSYNEVSKRYTEDEVDFYIPEVEHIGTQSAHNKQVRILDDIAPGEDKSQSRIVYAISCAQSVVVYKDLLEQGWPRELARGVLPTAMYSRMFATVNLNNLLKFLALRDHEHAQWEMQQYAKALRTLAHQIVPVTMRIVEESHG